MLWPFVALVLELAEPDIGEADSKGRGEAGGRDLGELAPGLAGFAVGGNGTTGVEDPAAVSNTLGIHKGLIHNAVVVEDAHIVDPAGVLPIVAAEGTDEAQEDIGLVYQRRVEADMSSCYFLAEGVNAVAHSPGDSPAAEGMLDVKGLPFVP